MTILILVSLWGLWPNKLLHPTTLDLEAIHKQLQLNYSELARTYSSQMISFLARVTTRASWFSCPMISVGCVRPR